MITRDELIDRLIKHDWYYEFSDDHSVWLRGVNDEGKLFEALKKLNKEDALILVQVHVPEMYRSRYINTIK